MTPDRNIDLDLTISRIIRASRQLVRSAWADPRSFEQWWIPAPLECRVVAMDMRPGGAFVTRMRESGGPYTPHLSACFLDIVEGERIVFTNALLAAWRPAESSFPSPLTAIVSFHDHPDGTEYISYVMHATPADRAKHEDLGFHDGWGAVIAQLATLVEARAANAAS